MPGWAKPEVDDRGNVTVSFGNGGKPLVFVAHMDEVGFEISSIIENGTAAVRTRGGMYLSIYESHPVMIVTPEGAGACTADTADPLPNGKEAQPTVDHLGLHFRHRDGRRYHCARRRGRAERNCSQTVHATGRSTGIRSIDGRPQRLCRVASRVETNRSDLRWATR